MIRRPLGIKLRRGPAPPVLLGLTAAGLLLLLTDPSWAGQYQQLALLLRQELALVVPFAVAAAAWHGGRDARRGLTELLGSTARPAWRPLLLGWLAVTVAAVAGYGVTAAVGLGLVRPVATYAGGSWPGLILVGAPTLAAFTAVGTLLGRLVPSRLTPPVAAIVSFVVVSWAGTAAGAGRLGPVIGTSQGAAYQLPGDLHPAQAAWFTGLAVAALLFAGGRRPLPRVGAASLAALAALPVLLVPSDELGNWPAWQPDPHARRLVCADGAPQVCVMQAHAFLLDDTVALLRPSLTRLTQAAGMPVAAHDSLGWEGLQPGNLHVQLSGATVEGGPLAPRLQTTYLFAGIVRCLQDSPSEDEAQEAAVRDYEASEAVLAWAGRAEVDTRFSRPGSTAGQRLEQLRRLPEGEQVRRVGNYLRAVRRCDPNAGAQL